MGAEQVMRYMGRSGRVGINDAVVTDRRRRSEGVRVKHWVNKNSLKFYDKGSVLRDEVTINDHEGAFEYGGELRTSRRVNISGGN